MNKPKFDVMRRANVYVITIDGKEDIRPGQFKTENEARTFLNMTLKNLDKLIEQRGLK
jgi:hypothetical protein